VGINNPCSCVVVNTSTPINSIVSQNKLNIPVLIMRWKIKRIARMKNAPLIEDKKLLVKLVKK